MAEKKPAISLRDVVISYGRAPVIAGLSLDVPEGQSFGLIGLNGVGKTTLIKTMLGLRTTDGGAVAIGGKDRLAPKDKKYFSYLPERFDPPWFLRGEEFLKFSAQLYGAGYDRAAAEALARDLALDPAVLRNRVQTYSKGMRQKLGFLSVLLTRSPLLILDEPMSGLDPEARALVKDALRAVRAEGRTIFFSSHILADMNEICDRVGVLHGGKLMYEGAPAGLLEQGGDANIEKAFLNLIGRKRAA